jgi:hypothetical protein
MDKLAALSTHTNTSLNLSTSFSSQRSPAPHSNYLAAPGNSKLDRRSLSASSLNQSNILMTTSGNLYPPESDQTTNPDSSLYLTTIEQQNEQKSGAISTYLELSALIEELHQHQLLVTQQDLIVKQMKAEIEHNTLTSIQMEVLQRKLKSLLSQGSSTLS